MASGAIETGGDCTVVDIFTAISSSPTIDTNARVSANDVYTGSPVLTYTGIQRTLVHIDAAVCSCIIWRTPASVLVYFIYTSSSILTQIPDAIVNIDITVNPSEAWQTRTLVAQSIDGVTGSAILTRTRITRNVLGLAPLTGITKVTETSVRADSVHAYAVNTRVFFALVDITCACASSEPLSTCAAVRIL